MHRSAAQRRQRPAARRQQRSAARRQRRPSARRRRGPSNRQAARRQDAHGGSALTTLAAQGALIAEQRAINAYSPKWHK
eukprot:10466284-Heterocapsa_arctica.AAC.1